MGGAPSPMEYSSWMILTSVPVGGLSYVLCFFACHRENTVVDVGRSYLAAEHTRVEALKTSIRTTNPRQR